MPLSERDFPKEFIKNKLATFRLTIKLSIYEKQKHPFVHLLASCLKMGRATMPSINTITNLHSVSRIFG
jgi:hypothetical protein